MYLIISKSYQYFKYYCKREKNQDCFFYICQMDQTDVFWETLTSLIYFITFTTHF